MPIPSAIKLHKASKTLELRYGEQHYSLSAEFLRDFFRKSIVARTDDDLAAVADEAACDRAADAGRAARNHGHLTRKSVGS